MNYKYIRDIDPEMIVTFWNQNIGDRFPLRKELWLQNSIHEKNVLHNASVAVIENGEVIGVIVSKKYQGSLPVLPTNIGWIQCLLVSEKRRNQGIGTKLLNIAEQAFKKESLEEVRLGRDPYHYFPGIPSEDEEAIRYFQKRGYQNGSIEIDLYRDVRGAELYQLTNSANHFRILEKQDLPLLLSFLKRSFPGRWHYEAHEYIQVGGTGREFLGLFIEGDLKGFCRINDSSSPMIAQNVYWSPLLDGPTGGIGPLGIDRSVRGRHFGLDIVKAAANELIERGMHHLIIDWTQLEQFYGKLLFQPWKKYQSMTKNIAQ